ncbi:unnamed protein product [Amaranthus hypochondriacus]
MWVVSCLFSGKLVALWFEEFGWCFVMFYLLTGLLGCFGTLERRLHSRLACSEELLPTCNGLLHYMLLIVLAAQSLKAAEFSPTVLVATELTAAHYC